MSTYRVIKSPHNWPYIKPGMRIVGYINSGGWCEGDFYNAAGAFLGVGNIPAYCVVKEQMKSTITYRQGILDLLQQNGWYYCGNGNIQIADRDLQAAKMVKADKIIRLVVDEQEAMVRVYWPLCT